VAQGVGFFVAFVTSQPEVDAAVRVAAERTSGDDTGWQVLGAAKARR
jgi:hypothetical protein